MIAVQTLQISTIALANAVLKYGFEHGIPVTPMKLQRLLYLIYATCLQETGQKLFDERFQCWKYGAVLDSVYNKFSCYRAKTITAYAPDAAGFVHILDVLSHPGLAHAFARVMSGFAGCSPTVLSDVTRANGSAWEKAVQNGHGWLQSTDIMADPCTRMRPGTNPADGTSA